MNMLALPVEVLCNGILPYLSICDLQALDTAVTNKHLRPQLQQVWESYQYDTLDVELKEDELFWLSGIGVRIISFTVERYVSTSGFNVINTPTVKRLRVVRSTILTFAANCPNLEELYLAETYESNIDDAVSAMAQNCRLMHTLKMWAEYFTDAGITTLARYCRELVSLSIGMSQVTDVGIQVLCDNCPNLKHIGLLNCHKLTDFSLITIANTYLQLQSLHVQSNRFTDDGFVYFADKHHELRSVSAWSENMTNRGLVALWDANPNLMDVNVKYTYLIPDEDVIQLVQRCTLLQKLNLSHCGHITDAAVIAVAEHCPQLTSLNIDGCKEVSGDSLFALGHHCPELKSIDISGLENISDASIAALAAGCPLLQVFYAIDSNITDAGVVALAGRCRDLRSIRLNLCMSIGVAAVSAVAENCPVVSELLMFMCGKVNDVCLYTIAQHCRNLTALEIRSTKVSDVDAVISVIKSCRMLREIDCSNCFRQELDREAIRKYAGCRLKVSV